MYHTYHRKLFTCLLLIAGVFVIFLLTGCASQNIVNEDLVLQEEVVEPGQDGQVFESISATSNLPARGKISGVITDAETGEPLPGVTVVLEGTVLGAVTDIDGYYVILNVPPGRYDIRISYIGYRDQVIRDVKISGDTRVQADFSIGAGEIELEEVRVDVPKPSPSGETSGEPKPGPPTPEPKPKPQSSPSPQPEPAPEPFPIDSLLADLPYGNIAFNTPPRMNLKETAYVQLLLDLRKSVAELKEMITEKGDKEGDTIKVAPKMEARLIGSHFDIETISPQIQLVTAEAVTEWKWEITPRDVGDHQLHLTLNVIVENDKTKRLIKTFDRKLRVEVTLGQKLSGFFSRNWQWLWAAIIVPLVGWLWKKRRESRQNA